MWAKHWPNLDMELEEKVIGGVPLRLPKNRPRSLREAMRRVVERYPEKEAIVYEDLHLTYRETCKRIDQISASLIRLGFQKGDRLGLLFANTLEFVYCYFAICQIGAVSVALNYRLSSEELEYQLINTEAKGLMMDEEYWPTLSPIRGRLPALERIFLVGNPEGKGVHSFKELQTAGKTVFSEPDLDEEDLASIMFTSGTTGRPKGVMLSHRNLICNGLNVAYAVMMHHDTRQLIFTPLFHVSALHAQLIPNFLLGGAAVILKKYSTKASLEIISREKINYLVAVPTIYWFLLKDPDLEKYDLSRIQVMLMGGAPCPPELILEFPQTFPRAKLMNGGGMTECSSGAWGLPPEYNLEKPGSVGFAFPCVDVRTVDGNGNDAGVNEPGELWYRGPAVAMGYWNNAQAWAEIFSDGWLHSGDIGKMDEGGFLWLLDRAKDMIIRGGQNIYCVEVENVLYQNAKVAEAAVVGVPDKIFG